MTSVSLKVLNSNKTPVIVINFGGGNLQEGFSSITAQLWSIDYPLPQQITGSLPPNQDLADNCQQWRSIYQALCQRLNLSSRNNEDDDDDWEIEEGAITQVSQIGFEEFSDRLQTQLNDWLKTPNFITIEQKLRTQLEPNIPLRLIIESDDDTLRRLPWYNWTFLEDYPLAEIALSRSHYLRQTPNKSVKSRKKVRILAILGNSEGIDLQKEQTWLNNLSDAEVSFLIKPSRPQLNQKLWDNQGWDMLFFAGHSQTEGATGRLYINEEETYNSLTIEQLKEALKESLKNGLQVAIFNSCDGLGLANGLGSLNIPITIVMREPVPNQVAQDFFHEFLQGYAQENLPLYLAVKKARRKLQGLENNYPGASWLPIIAQNPAFAPPSWLELGGIPPCPYRGLLAFTEADAALFCGREKVAEKLAQVVSKYPLVSLVGASGSGKSSVVFAGLVAKLRQDARLSWHIVSFRPGNNPFDGLVQAFTQLQDQSSTRLEELELELSLENNPLMIRNYLDEIIRTFPFSSRLLLIIDQFEELYTLCQSSQRQAFLDGLIEAIKNLPAFTVIITLRADFLGQVLESVSLGEMLQRYEPEYLLPMQREELYQAIAHPAALNGVQFETGLIEKLIDEVWGQAGHLPLLEFALTQLWDKQHQGWLTYSAYEEIGGVELALANYAEWVYAQLSLIDRERTQKIFIQLVHLGIENKATRRIATKEQVKYWDLVTQLASARLLITNRQDKDGIETVEIVHEALIEHWQRFRNWIEDNQDFLQWKDRLESNWYQWEIHDKQEGYLLKESPLLEAKNWLEKREQELTQSDKEFIESSLNLQNSLQKEEEIRQIRELKLRKTRTRLISVASVLTLGVLTVGGVAWQKQQQAQKEQLFRYASSQVITPEIAEKIFKVLPDYIKNAEEKQEKKEIEQAMEDYRKILIITQNTTAAMTENTQAFKPFINQERMLKNLNKQTESSLAKIIAQYRIPVLENQLKNKEFGQRIENTINPNLAEIKQTNIEYTGALETTYNILMGEWGAKADRNNNQILDEGEEESIPCDTLKMIEKLWREATNNHCGWYGSEDILEPNCQPLKGHTLRSILLYPPTIPELEKRLTECKIEPGK